MFNKMKAKIMKKVAAAADTANALAEGIQHASEHNLLYKEWKKNKEDDKFKIVLDNGDVIYKTVDKKYQPTDREKEAFRKTRNVFLVGAAVTGATVGGVIGLKKHRAKKAIEDMKEVEGEDYTIDLDENGNELIMAEDVNEESTDSNSAEA